MRLWGINNGLLLRVRNARHGEVMFMLKFNGGEKTKEFKCVRENVKGVFEIVRRESVNDGVVEVVECSGKFLARLR